MPSVKFNGIKGVCLKNKTLYEDLEFPNADELSKYEWKRPKEIVDDPKFITDGVSRFDAKQGVLGDCWLVSTIASLTLQQTFLEQVVPSDQSFDDDYCGMFYFRFWRFERWTEVIIDDRLPTENGSLLFMRSNDPNEFWSALLEKAYAKLYGSYQALVGGSTAEAMQDFTGGVTENIELNPTEKEDIFQIMRKAFQKTSFISAGIQGNNNVPTQTETKDGLHSGHAYSVIQIESIELMSSNEILRLVRLRNPWGTGEWNGDWSDNSACWEDVNLSDREKFNPIEKNDDGEFWMSFGDFLSAFHRMEICYTHPSDMIRAKDNLEVSSRWKLNSFHGKWIEGVTAGGCINNRNQYLLNPKYIIKLDAPEMQSANCDRSLVISLTQKNRRSKNKEQLFVGFTVHKIPDKLASTKLLDGKHLFREKSISSTFVNKRQICQRIKLDGGVYCIIPSTFHCDEEGEFLLRVYAECNNEMIEQDETINNTFATEQMHLQMESAEQQIANTEAIELFQKYAGDDHEIEPDELKLVLNAVLKEDMATGFSTDFCKSMVALKDDDLSGKLEIEEFKRLWADIHASKLVFNKNKTGNNLAAKDLSGTLQQIGFTISKRVLNVLVLRYGDVRRQIQFDDFLLCVIRLKNMIELFQEKFSRTKTTSLTLDEWLESTMYL